MYCAARAGSTASRQATRLSATKTAMPERRTGGRGAHVHPAGDHRDGDHHREHGVGGRRLHAHDGEQQEAERDRRVVARDRQREHAEQAQPAGQHGPAGDLVAAQADRDRRRRATRPAPAARRRPPGGAAAWLCVSARRSSTREEGKRSMSAPRRVARNAAVRMGGEIVAKLASLAFFVVMARELGARGFGEFQFALALTGALIYLAGFGTDQLLAREVARERGLAGPAAGRRRGREGARRAADARGGGADRRLRRRLIRGPGDRLHRRRWARCSRCCRRAGTRSSRATSGSTWCRRR